MSNHAFRIVDDLSRVAIPKEMLCELLIDKGEQVKVYTQGNKICIAKYDPYKEQRQVCGNCAYAVPTDFGNMKNYVECTNECHVSTHCKSLRSRKRARTVKACKLYLDKEEV